MNAEGHILAITGSIAEVSFSTGAPKRGDVLTTGGEYPAQMEVIASATPRSVYCLVLKSGKRLSRGQVVQLTGQPLMVPVGSAVLGRAFDIFSTPHDGAGPLPAEPRRPLHTTPHRNLNTIVAPKDIMETGIKAIDFFTPLLHGGKAALIGGAGVGKTVVLTQLAQRLVIRPQDKKQRAGVAVFSAVGERSREAQELYNDLKESGVLPKTTLILGQMGENPAVRFRTAYAGAVIAEYFRDEEKTDVLYYMDNLYRFAQAGHELATITNTIPSEDGYQATLTSEMASLNERLHSTKHASVSSFMALFVPGDDFTDAGVRAAFPFLDTTIILSRDIFQSGRYPAIDLLASNSAALTPSIVGNKHYLAYIQAKQILELSAELERIASLVGENELASDNQKIFRRAKLITNYMTQDMYLSAAETGHPDVSVPRKRTVEIINDIVGGKLDSVDPERLRYIDDATTTKIIDSAKKPSSPSKIANSATKPAVPERQLATE
ncbi:MAG: F0F1 ATP synthase subunit beta [Candidatus Andersenbacteria bacterium]|nr:F0F1 ATP synthase subunit beta [Candidatus Andersenbacteria bacterium]MBI3250796.1 F0F1 ATP synthase subunit beta [Candidatus Andersenbacteria bacterium]